MKRFLTMLAVSGLMAGAAYAGPTSPSQIEQVLKANSVIDTGVSVSDDGSYALVDGKVDLGMGEPVYFTARAMNCTGGSNCGTIIMFANFDMDGQPSLGGYQAVNEYNDSYPYGRAYIYTYDASSYAFGVDLMVDLNDENVFGANEIQNFEMVLSSFMSHMATADF